MRFGRDRCKDAAGDGNVGFVFSYGYIFHAACANGTTRFCADYRRV